MPSRKSSHTRHGHMRPYALVQTHHPPGYDRAAGRRAIRRSNVVLDQLRRKREVWLPTCTFYLAPAMLIPSS